MTKEQAIKILRGVDFYNRALEKNDIYINILAMFSYDRNMSPTILTREEVLDIISIWGGEFKDSVEEYMDAGHNTVFDALRLAAMDHCKDILRAEREEALKDDIYAMFDESEDGVQREISVEEVMDDMIPHLNWEYHDILEWGWCDFDSIVRKLTKFVMYQIVSRDLDTRTGLELVSSVCQIAVESYSSKSWTLYESPHYKKRYKR